MTASMGTCLSLIRPKLRSDVGGAGQVPLGEMDDYCHLHRDSLHGMPTATGAQLSKCKNRPNAVDMWAVANGNIIAIGQRTMGSVSDCVGLTPKDICSFNMLNSSDSAITSSSSSDGCSTTEDSDLPELADTLQGGASKIKDNAEAKGKKKSIKADSSNEKSTHSRLTDNNNEKSGLSRTTNNNTDRANHSRSKSMRCDRLTYSLGQCSDRYRSMHCKQTAGSGAPALGGSMYRSHGPGGAPQSERDLHELVNSAHRDGRTLLHKAAHQGDIKNVLRLLQCGAKVNERDCTKRTPLHEVADMGHVSVAKLLIEHGAKVNARDRWKCTPLHQAVAWKQARMIRLLLQHDARATGGTLLQDVIDMDPKEDVIVKLIQRGADVNATDMTGQTPMHTAVKHGRADIMWLLLNAGASLNKVSRGMIDGNHGVVLTNARRQLIPLHLDHLLQDGWSPLRMAQKYKHFDLVVWLVNSGANMVLCDSTGRFPQHKATMQRNCPSLHHIVAHPHCPIDIRDIEGNTAIKLNFEVHAKSMVDSNPQCGCCRNQPGTTPAPSCDEYANITILLLQHGADITDLYIHGYDLLYHLCSSKFSYDLRLMQAVLNSGNDLSELLSSAQPCLNALERQQRLDMYDYLAYFANSPRTLQDQCRLAIRSNLRRKRRGRSIWTAVTSLPLPNALIDSLLLQGLQGAMLTRHFAEFNGTPKCPDDFFSGRPGQEARRVTNLC